MFRHNHDYDCITETTKSARSFDAAACCLGRLAYHVVYVQYTYIRVLVYYIDIVICMYYDIIIHVYVIL